MKNDLHNSTQNNLIVSINNLLFEINQQVSLDYLLLC